MPGSRSARVLAALVTSGTDAGSSAIAELLDERVVWHGLLPELVCQGRGEVEAFMNRHAWPGHFTDVELHERGDEVIVRVRGPDFPDTGLLAATDPRTIAFTFEGDKIVLMESLWPDGERRAAWDG